MKRKKRFLSVLLVLSLVLASLPGEVFAAEPGGAVAGQASEDNADSQTQTETDGLQEAPVGLGEGGQDGADAVQEAPDASAVPDLDLENWTTTVCTPAEVTVIPVDVPDGQTQTEAGKADEMLEISSASEENIQAYGDAIQHDLGNGAILYFDPESGTITGCVPGEVTEIQIPSEIDGVSVTSVGDMAFILCENLTDIAIPDSVISIGERAFERCSSLTGIRIPDSVTSIGDFAFSMCDSLTRITIPGSVAATGNYAFQFCSNLESVTLGEGVTSIGERAFECCGSLTDITIPDSVTSIGSGAFWECGKLTDIVIPGNVTYIGNGAFVRCVGLTSIIIPEGVTAIEGGTFSECRNLTDVTIPDSVISIESTAFLECSFTDITIPDSVTFIGWGAFWRCDRLKNINIPGGVTSIGEKTFAGCSNLTSVLLQEGVTSIADDAFDGCNELTIFCWPDSYAESYAQESNIPYKYFVKDSRMLSVVIWDEDGNTQAEGFSVTWYDEDGNPFGTGQSLGDADIGKTYAFEIQLSEELAARYVQPERQTIAPEDEAVCNVQLILKPVIPVLKLEGRILNKEGQPIESAVVSVVTADSEPMEAVIGGDSAFSVEVPCTVVQITVRKDGYYSRRIILDLSSETGDSYQMDDIVLSEVITVSDQVTLDIIQKAAVEDGGQALETPVVSAKALLFELTGNDGRSITDYEVQGTTLFFRSGAVSANETITVTVTDPAGTYTGSSAAVTLDGDRMGSAELTMTEKGSFLLGRLSGPEANLLVFGDDGSCIRTCRAQGGMSSGTMDAGNYHIVLLQKSSLLGGVPYLDYLSTLGLKAGQDYLLRDITISDGNIVRLDDCTVPVLNESAMSYVVAENTSVTTNKSGSAALGDLVLIRAAYKLDSSRGVSAGELGIVLPEGLALTDNSVALIDGRQTTYTYDSARREVKFAVANRSSATVYLNCYAVSPGAHSASAYLTLSNGAVQPMGTAVVQVETAKMNVVEQTGIAEGLTASGKTLPDSTVVLYDNDEEVGRTTSNKAGSWSMKFDLVQPVYSYSYHFVRAVTENSSLPDPIATEEFMITYRKDSAGQVTKITMYNTADQGPQTTVFDFTEAESTEKPYYRMWPGMYPTFTFKVEFAGDASTLTDVYVVTTDSAGNQTYVETTYDAASNAWVGTHDYTTFQDAPVGIGAKCTGSGDIGIAYDEEKEADFVNAYYDAVDEISGLLAPMLDSMLEFSNEVFSGNSYAADVKCFDPQTKALMATGTMYISLDSFEEEITDPMLVKEGYKQDDIYDQLWYKVDITNVSVHLNQIDLSDNVVYTMLIDLIPVTSQQRTADVDVYPALYAVASTAKIVGLSIGIAAGIVAVVCVPAAGAAAAIAAGTIVVSASVGAFTVASIVEDSVGCAEGIHGEYWAREAVGNYNRLDDLWKINGVGDAGDNDFFNDYSIPAEIRNSLARKRDAIQDNVSNYQQVASDHNKKISGLSRKLLDDSMINFALDTVSKEDKLSWIMDMKETVENVAKKMTEDELLDAKNEMRSEFNSYVREIMDYRLELDAAKKAYGYDFDTGHISFSGNLIMRYAQTILDPSGYLYEAVPTNRLEGATAVISCEAENGSAWNAEDYDQVNPQLTGTDGAYYWDVPEGNWKVSFTKDGYEPTDTQEVARAAGYEDGWLPVPPPQLEINVGMISTAAPAVKQAVAYTNRVEVEFSQYMDMDSVVSGMSLAQNDVDISSCRVVPLNAEYNLENTMQYATRFSIIPDGSELSDGVTVSVAGTAVNYAGTPMGEGYTSPSMTPSARPTGIAAPDKVSVVLHEETSINVVLQPGIEERKLTVESLSPVLVTVGSEEVITGKSGEAEISLTGILPGNGQIRICEPESGLNVTIDIQVGAVRDVPDITVEPVTAVLEDGTLVTNGMAVPAGTKILLQTQTADAVIRYTLDDTCPCTEEALTYSAPITIQDSTVLRAAAQKDGIYSTTIRLELSVAAAPEHTHSWAAEWAGNETHHWHECTADGCTVTENSEKKDYGEHSYDSDTDTDCNICGYIRTVSMPTPSHAHSWAAEWRSNSTHHWHECTAVGCDITIDSGKNGYGAHVYDNDTDTNCNICGFVRTVAAPSGQTYTITFNASGGMVNISSMVTGADGRLGSLPAPTRDGYTFDGWYTAENGGTQITTDTEFRQSTTVYAHWQRNSGNGHTASAAEDSAEEHTSPLTDDSSDAADSYVRTEARSCAEILLFSLLSLLAITAALAYGKKKKE